jgi:BirA family biotin operon repressor/biotin-[acetyl-CoA-carboxylase] ligase
VTVVGPPAGREPVVSWTVRRVERTGSTNADVAAAARDGAAEGLALVADHQAAGRGRLGRVWETPPGAALTVSFLLRPVEVAAARWPLLTLLAGVAVVDALQEVAPGVRAALKWPNDVVVGGAKLAGILAERIDTPAGPAAVVGIGLNLRQRAGADLVAGATSLVALGATDPDRDAVLGVLAERLGRRYVAWRAAGGPDSDADLMLAYRRRCDTLGRAVRAELPGGTSVQGRAVDVDSTGRLVIGTRAGSTTAVSAGDVVHLRGAGSRDAT